MQALNSFSKLRLRTKFLLGWFILDLVLSVIIAKTTGDFSLATYLLLWISLSIIAYKIRPPFFIFSAVILAFLEETIVYYLRGGLQGAAKSLVDDLAGAMPVFLAMIMGWWFVLKRYHFDEESLYLFSGMHGFFVEIVASGLILNPVAILLFGGSSIFIYATIIICPQRPKAEENIREVSISKKIVLWLGILALIIIGGIIGDTLRKFLV